METVSVIVPDGVDITACTAKESSRYAIAGVYVAAKGNQVTAAATDGRCLSLTRCDSIEGTTWAGIVPADLMPGKSDKLTHHRTLTLNGTATRATRKGTTSAPLVEGTFPPVASVVPEFADNALGTDDTYCHHVVTLDPELLLSVAKAIQELDDKKRHVVTLLLPKNPHRAIGVLGNRGIGVMMPVETWSRAELIDQYTRERTARLESL